MDSPEQRLEQEKLQALREARAPRYEPGYLYEPGHFLGLNFGTTRSGQAWEWAFTIGFTALFLLVCYVFSR
jgi:hypothetical protein